MNAKIAAFFKKLKFCWWVLTNKEYQTNNEPIEDFAQRPNVGRLVAAMKEKGLSLDESYIVGIPEKIVSLKNKEGKQFTFWECNGITHALNNHKEVEEMITQVLAKQDDA